MNRRRLAGALVAALFVSACQDRNEVIWHPTPENVQTASAAQFVLHEDTASRGPWTELLSQFPVTLGVGEGEPLDMIGQVRDMAIGHNRLYYADFIYGHVREYDFQGNLISVIGKRGQGPGEFALLNKVALAQDEGVLAIAGSPIHVSVFSREAGAWIHKKTFIVPPNLMDGDLCTMHGHVYTIGYSEGAGGVIHKYTLEGERLVSFGRPYSNADPFIGNSLSQRGDLVCNATHSVVAYRHALSPVITGFSDNGKMQWNVELADADIGPVKQTLTEDGLPSIGFTSAPSRTNRPHFVSISDSEFVLVQYAARGESGRGAFDSHHLYRINAATGQGVYSGWYPVASTPRIRAWDSRHLYTTTTKPYPQIKIYAHSTTL